MSLKYLVIIQCDIAQRRCSGFACTNAFYTKEELFKDYDNNVRYISFTCGGCCGKGVSAKLEHLTKKLKTKDNVVPEEVVIHLASCMVTDNYHYDRCPHVEFIKGIIRKKGYPNIIEGSSISKTASKRRVDGVYKNYEQ